MQRTPRTTSSTPSRMGLLAGRSGCSVVAVSVVIVSSLNTYPSHASHDMRYPRRQEDVTMAQPARCLAVSLLALGPAIGCGSTRAVATPDAGANETDAEIGVDAELQSGLHP